MSLFRQEKRIGRLLGLPFYMSGGSKHRQAEVAWLPPLPVVAGTFKLWLSVLTDAGTNSELSPRKEIDTANRIKVLPGWQVHVKPLTVSIQMPSFTHGLLSQSSTSISQYVPV